MAFQQIQLRVCKTSLQQLDQVFGFHAQPHLYIMVDHDHLRQPRSVRHEKAYRQLLVLGTIVVAHHHRMGSFCLASFPLQKNTRFRQQNQVKKVQAKKHLGQHFLTDEDIAFNITAALSGKGYQHVLEVGPGMGVLTKYLEKDTRFTTHLIELDHESVVYLNKHFPDFKERTNQGDFLQFDLNKITGESLAIIGNFPYNISSQIFFKVLDHKDKIPECVGMLQKEVAARLASPPGNKDYGILSVLLQAYYKVEYLFTVPEHVFDPPPKVKSGVIRVTRNGVQKLDCDEVLFKRVVKQGFNMRRKTLRNALKSLNLPYDKVAPETLDKRAEQLSVQDFVDLTNKLSL